MTEDHQWQGGDIWLLLVGLLSIFWMVFLGSYFAAHGNYFALNFLLIFKFLHTGPALLGVLPEIENQNNEDLYTLTLNK